MIDTIHTKLKVFGGCCVVLCCVVSKLVFPLEARETSTGEVDMSLLGSARTWLRILLGSDALEIFVL